MMMDMKDLLVALGIVGSAIVAGFLLSPYLVHP